MYLKMPPSVRAAFLIHFFLTPVSPLFCSPSEKTGTSIKIGYA